MRAELLAPAGSYESLKAAIQAGADAVYIGGSRFGARAYAKNPEEDILLDAIDYVHLRDKKIYLTVNTLLKNNEMNELYDYLAPYYEHGLDAVIVQDVGVFDFIRRQFPDLPIHASTQMTITGEKGAKFLEELGATRVVTAREVSLAEIERIRDTTDLEIESFVHGALCYCYSGQCLFSSMIGGRSGNRGRCAQPCRLLYQLYQGKDSLSSQKYLLSPKDMCTIEILPQIIESGVFSLKIEGRMKKPEYTAGVVSIYRKYLDLYLKNPSAYHVEKEDLQKLYDIYNRDGFHKSYYQQYHGKNMMAFENEKQEKIGRNEKLFDSIREKYIQQEKKLGIEGEILGEYGEPITLRVHRGDISVTAVGDLIEVAKKQPISFAQIEKKMRQTGETPFEFIHLEQDVPEGMFLPVSSLNALRRNALEALEQELLLSQKRQSVEKLSFENSISSKTEEKERILRVSVESMEQLEAALAQPQVDGIYANLDLFANQKIVLEFLNRAKKAGKEFYLALPVISRKKIEFYPELLKEGLSGYLVRNLENFAQLKEQGLAAYVVCDHNLYTYNNNAVKFWEEQKVLRNTVPLELNRGEIRHRRNDASEMIVYGYLPLMVTVQCLMDNTRGCSKKNETMLLKDRKGSYFPVKCNCNSCYNTIYNSLPLGLQKECAELFSLGIYQARLMFTVEDAKETKERIQEFVKAYKEGESLFEGGNYTKGHFKRGVE